MNFKIPASSDFVNDKFSKLHNSCETNLPLLYNSNLNNDYYSHTKRLLHNSNRLLVPLFSEQQLQSNFNFNFNLNKKFQNPDSKPKNEEYYNSSEKNNSNKAIQNANSKIPTLNLNVNKKQNQSFAHPNIISSKYGSIMKRILKCNNKTKKDINISRKNFNSKFNIDFNDSNSEFINNNYNNKLNSSTDYGISKINTQKEITEIKKEIESYKNQVKKFNSAQAQIRIPSKFSQVANNDIELNVF